MTHLRPALLAWLLLAVVMLANGTARVLVLQPRLGEPLARQVATLTGIALVLLVAFLLVRRLDRPSPGDLVKVGALWLVLTLLFEFGMGWVSGASVETMLADYDIRQGRLWPLALLVIFAAPWMWGAALGSGKP